MRLHALVLGLEHDRPVIACDPSAGGAKVTSQAAALDWPVVLAAAVQAAGEAGRRANARTRAWFTEQLAG
jgi:hypothetical protein